MKAKLTRVDGSILEVEGSPEEIERALFWERPLFIPATPAPLQPIIIPIQPTIIPTCPQPSITPYPWWGVPTSPVNPFHWPTTICGEPTPPASGTSSPFSSFLS